MLTAPQLEAATLLALGELPRPDVAQRVGISERTLYRWTSDLAPASASGRRMMGLIKTYPRPAGSRPPRKIPSREASCPSGAGRRPTRFRSGPRAPAALSEIAIAPVAHGLGVHSQSSGGRIFLRYGNQTLFIDN